jgi:squalene synthase HpnC
MANPSRPPSCQQARPAKRYHNNVTPVSNAAAEVEALRERGWAALPASYAMPKVAPNLQEARAWCKHLAETHYENFHVASWFLPEKLRPHFHAVYAYCRVSDDLGDEARDRPAALALLDQWSEELDACYQGVARHPVFVALAQTIRACQIPKGPFSDLLVAFRQDQLITRYRNQEEVLKYCGYSANPVGRLVLYICGYSDSERFRLSDATCSALQLANFWQDVTPDYRDRDRIYLPQDAMDRFGVTEESISDGIASGKASPEFKALLADQVAWARELFANGLPLISMVDTELALDLDLFSRGGLEILNAIEKCGYDVLAARPTISKATKLGLAFRAVAGKLLPGLRLKSQAP